MNIHLIKKKNKNNDDGKILTTGEYKTVAKRIPRTVSAATGFVGVVNQLPDCRNRLNGFYAGLKKKKKM